MSFFSWQFPAEQMQLTAMLKLKLSLKPKQDSLSRLNQLRRSTRLQDDRDALPAANASRPNRRLGPAFRDRVCQVGSDARARRAKRVAESDRSAANVRLRHVQAEFLGAGEELRREGFVDVHQVDFANRHARLGQRLLDRGDRADPHARGVDADRGVRDQLGKRGEPVLAHRLATRQHQRARAVADPRRGGGGHDAVLLEGRRELGHLLERGRPRVLVGVEDLLSLLGLQADRADLAREDALRLRLLVACLRLQRVLVGHLPRDAVVGRQVLGGHPHRTAAVRIREARPQRVNLPQVGAELRAEAHVVPVDGHGRLAHALRARGDAELRLAQQDLLRDGDDRLEAASAQPVHVERGRVDLHPRLERNVPRDVRRIDRSLRHVADDDGVDHAGGDAAGGERGLRGVDAQVRRAELHQLPPKGTKGGALRGHDEDAGGH
mmetsp:Transcript_28436/g.69221  ORF Transcript_28436/g.69221 Transcript_28436/m.69221 type:complete len:437 (+) Transcript_28436:325-1635(+)